MNRSLRCSQCGMAKRNFSKDQLVSSREFRLCEDCQGISDTQRPSTAPNLRSETRKESPNRKIPDVTSRKTRQVSAKSFIHKPASKHLLRSAATSFLSSPPPHDKAFAAVRSALDKAAFQGAPHDPLATLKLLSGTANLYETAQEFFGALFPSSKDDPDAFKQWLEGIIEWLKALLDVVATSDILNAFLKNQTTWWPFDVKDLVRLNSTSEVVRCVQDARKAKKTVRICGAQHSVPRAVFDTQETNSVVMVKLEGELMGIRHLGNGLFEVGAGCHLGVDPHDPASTEKNSFTRVADSVGYGLGILGGMSHHTIGGFLATSTAGGSLKYGMADALVALELVDGTGAIRKFSKTDPNPDLFNAAAVSFGLLGVVTRVWLQLMPNYFVKGVEQTVQWSGSVLDYTKPGSFLKAATSNDYQHNVWFPNPGCTSVLEFTGSQAPHLSPNDPNRVPYYHVLDDRPSTPTHDSKAYMNVVALIALVATNWVEAQGWQELVGLILSIVNAPFSTPFNDYWWITLPNDDNALIDTIIRVQFTEIWIDVQEADQVLAALGDMFQKDPTTCGTFGVEVYSAKKNDWWLSMAYGRDVIRIDPYWFEYNTQGNLTAYFTPFWKLLHQFPSARLHWGKHWPTTGTQLKDRDGNIRTIGLDYCQKSYPRFNDWLKVRSQLDPDNVFVTPYWRNLLGLPGAVISPDIPVGPNKPVPVDYLKLTKALIEDLLQEKVISWDDLTALIKALGVSCIKDLAALLKMDPPNLFSILIRLVKQLAKPYAISYLSQKTPFWPVDDKDIRKCNNLRQIQDVISEAKRTNKIVRVCGAQGSNPQAVFNPTGKEPKQIIRIKLEGDFRKCEQLPGQPDVWRAGAGMNLGVDPHDPTSNVRNSFNHIVDKAGYGLPILGGNSLLTWGGFLTSGTAGGSIHYGLEDYLISFEIVDGNGQARTLRQGEEDFWAAGVSMGLFGIVTFVTVKLIPRYFLQGTQNVAVAEESVVASGKTFIDTVSDVDVQHNVWLPNPGLNGAGNPSRGRVLQFTGNRAAYDPSRLVRYVNLLDEGEYHEKLTDLGCFFILIAANQAQAAGNESLVAFLLDLATPLSDPTGYNDYWWRAVPNDDEMSLTLLIRVQMAEIWIDLSQSDEVFTKLKAMWAKDSRTCGNFGCQFYSAKKSQFWMSMSYGRDVIRVDPFWFEYNPEGTLDSFFGNYWQALVTAFPSARLHWMGHWPKVGTTFNGPNFSRTIGKDYCRKAFPKYDEWIAKRAKFDPSEVFVTDYWRGLLGL